MKIKAFIQPLEQVKKTDIYTERNTSVCASSNE